MAELEPVLVGEGLGQGLPERVWVEGALVGELELREDDLEGAEDARVAHARVAGQTAVAAPEHVQVPEHLRGQERRLWFE